MGRKVCVRCGELLEILRVGLKVRVGQYLGYFMGDLWVCPSCHYEIIELADAEVLDESAVVDYDFSANKDGW